MRMKVRVKICCIKSIEEAKLAMDLGASALGLVSAMPSGPGVITESLAWEIAEIIPPGVASVLLTSQQDAQGIITQQRTTRVNTIQICDALPMSDYPILKDSMPGVSLIQVIHVTGEESVQEAIQVSEHVNAILLDSGNPKLSVKELGGTGRTHNWEVSRKICESVSVPVFLAGGLKAENIVQAVQTVRPFGVDICSGVRTQDNLDATKLASFMKALS